MQTSTISTARGPREGPQTPGTESSVSAISWGAIFGGAAVIGAMTILLVTLGSGLALQLHSPFQMRALCGGLMSPPPERPGNDMGRIDAPLRKLRGDAADFLG
jgi:hypothetical protein